MENIQRNAYDAAFKLKVINLRWDCENDNEETEASDKVLRLFNSDTEEDDFDGFSAQEEDEEGDQWHFLVGYCFSVFFLPAVLQALFGKKSICSMYLFMLPYAFN